MQIRGKIAKVAPNSALKKKKTGKCEQGLYCYFPCEWTYKSREEKLTKCNINIRMNPESIWTWHVPNDEGACAVCEKATKHRCNACKTVYYCSTDHQKVHWKIDHKKNCGLIELVTDPQFGRHYIAKRNIEPGEIVLREKGPLVLFVSPFINNLVCVNCYTDSKGKEGKLCKKCGWWPLCAKCNEHGAECEFTIKYGKFKNLPDKGKAAREEFKLQNAVGIIRTLALRDTNPKAYSKFIMHEDHYAEMKARYGDKMDTDVAKLVLKFFNIDNAQESEMAKINRILLISAFGIENYSYFAEKTSYFQHNCRPNCAKTLPDNKNIGSFLVWAVRPIAAGENVSICYYNGDVGTMQRKDWLASTKFFDCTCLRCEDPTEFGTMFNAVKCIKDRCTGDMLPATFKMCNGKYPDFVCRECKAVLSSKIVAAMELQLADQLSAIEDEDVYSYKCFIEENSYFLNKNHFHMVKAKLQLADVIGFDAYIDSDITMVSNKELNEKIQLSEEICELHELLMPGYTRCRGRLLYGTAIALGEKIKRVGPKMHIRNILINKYIMALTETCKLLCYESQSSEEGQMAREAMKLLQLVKRGLI